VVKNLSEKFPNRNGLKHGDALSPLLFNFALEYAFKRVQVNQDGLKLNGTHQLLACADDVNVLGESVHTVKENVEALVVAVKETGLEVNADKAKYMVMCRDRNAGRGHNLKTDNSLIGRVEEFRYLETMLRDQNSIQEEIKSRLKLGNACCHSVHKLLSSRFARNIHRQLISEEDTFFWLSKGDLKAETENEIEAAQDQVIQTKCDATKTLNTETDGKCKLCQQFEETME
jgi:hypothetical protein